MNAPPRLDARQRAMLAEMGVRLWSPAPAPEPPPAPPPAVPATTARAPATGAPAPALARGAAPARAPTALPAHPAGPVAPRVALGAALGTRPAGIEQMDWPALRAAVAGCTACGLCAGRRHTVFGVGDPGARWMVIGEAPGEQEDARGEPFVGPAGQLLDAMLAAIGLSRHARADAADATDSIAGYADGTRTRGTFDAKTPQPVFIANVLKCRPPGNRNPQPDEMAQCEPYLRRQVALLRPRLILAMGRFAVQSLLQTTEPVGRLRGRVHRYAGVPVIVTYHPAYLLRNLADKAKAWDDLVLALETAAAPADAADGPGAP